MQIKQDSDPRHRLRADVYLVWFWLGNLGSKGMVPLSLGASSAIFYLLQKQKKITVRFFKIKKIRQTRQCCEAGLLEQRPFRLRTYNKYIYNIKK